jgi:hypothetical protein
MDTEPEYLEAFAANIAKLGISKLLTPIEHAIASATFDRITNRHRGVATEAEGQLGDVSQASSSSQPR